MLFQDVTRKTRATAKFWPKKIMLFQDPTRKTRATAKFWPKKIMLFQDPTRKTRATAKFRPFFEDLNFLKPKIHLNNSLTKISLRVIWQHFYTGLVCQNCFAHSVLVLLVFSVAVFYFVKGPIRSNTIY